MLRLLAGVFVACLPAVLAESGPLLRKPTVSRTHIVFSYAGDLWSVPREGGDARRLTTGPGVETDPVFSPDGTQIAFTGEYDGNTDVFVMPASGGTPRRLTWHPYADRVVGWTPDGKRVLFMSFRVSPNDDSRLFTIGLDGGFPEQLPLPIAGDASYSPDGSHLAYEPIPNGQAAWKRYRGGMAEKVWIADLADSSVVPVPRERSVDSNPMWIGDCVYFLSDRSGPVTLYCYDTRSRQVKQVLENRGLDLKSASAGPGVIVYEQFGSLHLYDVKSGTAKEVKVRVAGDLPEVRPRFVNVGGRLRNASLSPNGARVAFEARGEILTVPAEKGDARNLTNTAGVMERTPSWSPDGKTVAYYSDESGEYMLHLRDQNGMGEVKKISLSDKPSFYYTPRWSPDSKKIAYQDSHGRIWYLDLEQKKPVLVDTDYYPTGEDFSPVWSPDSKWLAYRKQLKSHMSAIYLYALADAKSTQATDGLSEAVYPVFDKGGKYLYFAASTDSGPGMEPDVLGRGRRATTYSVYVMVLARNEASPLAPESDEEKAAEEKKDEAKKEPEKVDVKIDLEKIGQRILSLPLPPREYQALEVGKAGILYAAEVPPRGPGADPGITIHRFDLKKRKSDVPFSGVRGFQVSFNGEKVLYRQADRWMVVTPRPMPEPGKPAPPADDTGKGALKTSDLEVRVDPRAEWKQMYHEVWRIEREFFYDAKYHGLDLAATEKRYEPFLDQITSRRDLNYLFTDMLGELSVGHMYISGGDMPRAGTVKNGLLGADYKVENGRYRFARIYNGENWNPDLKAPLTQPGVDVAVGDYLIAVNGREVRGSDNIYSFFESTAGKSVALKVGADPTGAQAREVIVVPVDDEHNLRHLAWIEDNRRKVDQATNGRVAYIHMPDTAGGGATSFNRYFFAQLDKDAVIVDERFNHGGSLATDIIEFLRRPVMSMVSPRDGAAWAQPLGAIFGPKVMIANSFAGSGGDIMPWYFKRFGVGKVVGTRTWGGVVGIGGYPQLMDGGAVTAPSMLIFNPQGNWELENEGLTPDIEVEQDPKAVRQGRDPQLEKAIEVVMKELGEHPLPVPKRPASPDYHAQ